jgi:hypothetical protein
MGATSWRYYTAHQPAPEDALEALQADVFARGDYVQPINSIDDILLPTVRRLGRNPDSPEDQRQVEMELKVHRAVETGDMSELSPAIRAFAMQIRALSQATGMQGPTGKRGPKRSAARPKRPRSIKELRERAGESGTHSILDIERVGLRLDFAVAAPMSAESVRKAFGTDTPTREEIERRWEDLAERLDRWQAYYLVVYHDGQPHEYAFIGCSGD